MITIEAELQRAIAEETALAADALAEPWLTAAFLDETFIPQAHHKLISAELKHFAATPDARLMISTPPQVGKTTMAVNWFAFWLLARDPTCRIIIGSYAKDPAKERGEAIRGLIREHGWRYDLTLKRGSETVTFFKTSEGGYVRSVGRGGSTTGLSADVFLVDDPIKDWIEATSPAMREKVWMWLASVVRTRLSAGGRVMLVATRWNRDDPTGRYERLQPGRWRKIILPAVATSLDDPLGRAIGEPLPKPGIDEHDHAASAAWWEEAKQEVPGIVYMALYQADPTPAGGKLITAEILHNRIDMAPAARPVDRAVSVDPSVGDATSASENSNQSTCGIVAGWLGDDQRVYLTHDKTRVYSVHEWPAVVMQLAYDTHAGVVFVEGNQGGKAFLPLLVAAWDELKRDGKVQGYCPQIDIKNAVSGMSKEQRARVAAGLFERDLMRLAGNLPELFAEYTSWVPGDPSPGRVDASGQLAFRLLPEQPTGDGTAVSPATSGLLLAQARSAYPWRG